MHASSAHTHTHTQTGTGPHEGFVSVGTTAEKALQSIFLFCLFLGSPQLPASSLLFSFLLFFWSSMFALTMTEDRLLLPRQKLVTETKALAEDQTKQQNLFLSREAGKMSATL